MKNSTSIVPLWMQIRKTKTLNSEQEKVEFLRRTPFFDGLTLKQSTLVAKILHERTYLENEFIFETNQPGAALFFIQSGEVSIEIDLEHGHMGQVATLTDGDFLGELALLDDSPRSASARAVKPCRTLALFRNDLLSLIKTQPEIACQLYKALALVVGERLKATNMLLGQTHSAYRKAG